MLRIVERAMSEGDARAGAVGLDLGTEQPLSLLQAEGFRHRDRGRAQR